MSDYSKNIVDIVPSFEAIKARLDRQSVEAMLQELGYRIQSHRTALREERTPSAQIYPDGHIYDFGAAQSYDIVDILTEFHGMDSREARQWVGQRLGLSGDALPAAQRHPIPSRQSEPPPVSLEEVKREFDRFQAFSWKNPQHRQAFTDIAPAWLYEQAHRVDEVRFGSMVRYDPKEGCIVAGCFDEGFNLISYKHRRKRGIKWCARKATHPNHSLTVRTLRTRPGPLHIIEGHRDALTATLLGLNYAMLPTASWKPTDEGIEAVTKAALECGGRLIRFWAEDAAAYKAMRPFAERLAARFEVEIKTYPGAKSGEKVDLSDIVSNGQGLQEVRRVAA